MDNRYNRYCSRCAQTVMDFADASHAESAKSHNRYVILRNFQFRKFLPWTVTYNHHNRRKYSLKVHIVLVTKYRKQLLKGTIADDVKQKIFDICNSNGWNIIAMETDKDHVHFLVSYDATDRICDIIKVIKQQTTYYLWQKYANFLPKQYWKKKIF